MGKHSDQVNTEDNEPAKTQNKKALGRAAHPPDKNLLRLRLGEVSLR